MDETLQPPPLATPDDRRLWQQLLDAEDRAGASLRADVWAWVWAYLRPRLDWMSDEQLRHWADECTQAACARILGRLHLYRGEGALLGWCRAVALRVTIDWIRQDRRARLISPKPLSEEIGQTADPSAEIEKAAELRKIQSAIDGFIAARLSQREQRIVRENETDRAALAAELGITPNNLYQIRYRALVKIRRHLESLGYTRQRLQEGGCCDRAIWRACEPPGMKKSVFAVKSV